MAEKDKEQPGWQMRSFSYEDSKDEIYSHFPNKKLQNALKSNSKKGFHNNHTSLFLSSFQVPKSPLLGLALPEAEFDSGKISV